jgi:hypothetical protein
MATTCQLHANQCRALLQAMELSDVPFKDQVWAFMRTGVLLGAHGAGLSNQMWMPSGRRAAVVELWHGISDVFHYTSMASMLDHHYFNLQGSGTQVNIEELTNMANQAMDAVATSWQTPQLRQQPQPLPQPQPQQQQQQPQQQQPQQLQQQPHRLQEQQQTLQPQKKQQQPQTLQPQKQQQALQSQVLSQPLQQLQQAQPLQRQQQQQQQLQQLQEQLQQIQQQLDQHRQRRQKRKQRSKDHAMSL